MAGQWAARSAGHSAVWKAARKELKMADGLVARWAGWTADQSEKHWADR